jgi:hypothetical protein
MKQCMELSQSENNRIFSCKICGPVHCIALPPTPGWQRSTSKC